MSGGVVYRAYAPGGELLYIGSAAGDGHRRIAQHVRASVWCTPDVRFETEPHETREAASEAEAWAIGHEQPRENRDGKDRFPDGTRTPAGQARWDAVIAKRVAAAPPLSDRQRDRLAGLLRPVVLRQRKAA